MWKFKDNDDDKDNDFIGRLTNKANLWNYDNIEISKNDGKLVQKSLMFAILQ